MPGFQSQAGFAYAIPLNTSIVMSAASQYGVTWNANALLGGSNRTLYAAHYFAQPTVTLGGNTLGTAATVYIANAPTNGTSKYAFYSAAGANYFGGVVTFAANALFTNTYSINCYGLLEFDNGSAQGYGAIGFKADDGIHYAIDSTDGRGNRSFVFIDMAFWNSDFDHDTLQASPTIFLHSATDPDTDNTEYCSFAWNDWRQGGDAGSFLGLKSMTEEITVAVGQGAGGVASSTNLAPANSWIVGFAFRVTQAPGGGATTLDAGITGGDLDAYIDGASCDILGETGNFYLNHNVGVTAPIFNASATTMTLTTDANVTVTNMKIRVVVWYFDLTAPTA